MCRVGNRHSWARCVYPGGGTAGECLFATDTEKGLGGQWGPSPQTVAAASSRCGKEVPRQQQPSVSR